MELLTIVLFFNLSYSSFLIYLLGSFLLKCGANINQESLREPIVNNDLIILNTISMSSNIFFDNAFIELNRYFIFRVTYNSYEFINSYYKKFETHIYDGFMSLYGNKEPEIVDISNILRRKKNSSL